VQLPQVLQLPPEQLPQDGPESVRLLPLLKAFTFESLRFVSILVQRGHCAGESAWLYARMSSKCVPHCWHWYS